MKQGSLLDQLPEPLPEMARLVGILLAVQALLRLAFLAMPLWRFGFAYVNVFTVIQTLVGLAGLGASILTLQRYVLARLFGLAFCAIGLLLQLYGIFRILSNGFALRLSMFSWILILIYVVIYVFGLIAFSFLPYFKSAPEGRVLP
jgi:hypothetical protein